MDDSGGDLLVLLLDTRLFTPCSDGPQQQQQQQGSPQTMLEQVLYFVGSYRLLHDNNQLAVFAVRERACDPIYMQLGEDTTAALSSTQPNTAIRDGLLQAMKQEAAPGPAALSGALSRALCLIHRLRSSPAAAAARARSRSRPRILFVSASPDVPLQYIPVMNAIFSAQRAEVAIDALVLYPADSAFLQQATHLTGGLYFRPSQRGTALQHLVQSLSADTHTRSLLAVHQPLGVDFRAACFCHKTAIDVGYVCSVCLSIFCCQADSCSICGTKFAKRRRAAAGAAAGGDPGGGGGGVASPAGGVG